jgi:hypothetical protein
MLKSPLISKGKIVIYEISGDGRKKVDKINFHYCRGKFSEEKDLLGWVRKEIVPGYKKGSICKKVNARIEQDSNSAQQIKRKINAQDGMQTAEKVVVIVEIVF